ncbi:topology modulation protein [Variibacter gotjawalensis]|uniref:Topology modulation protein n=1 Tax=Variibacter gotjawalensis TaxID=1333996 RepID=A0A0S3PWY6_9BRAD|nr:DNA topology modulation protein [Variibacter gotjawalensis]NIK46273.1 adenylate kinase family enzyme [Variibacter gotjawalensis]RZS48188.1 adenylate kinase family enzyme [Variibacter gotjawalensis]BAT60445.1 topology modulation protein [Variibacter gotjawalensis]
MQRVLVIGCSGAGKSTLARVLSEKLQLPLHSLDQMFWQPGWTEPDGKQFAARVATVAAEPKWIIEGTFLGHAGEVRRERAEAVIWLDFPRWTCLAGVLTRTLQNYGRVRFGMAEGCPERFDWEFLRYIWTFNQIQRPGIVEYVARLRPDQRLIVLASRRSVTAFLGGKN